jgi:hypothetical protein
MTAEKLQEHKKRQRERALNDMRYANNDISKFTFYGMNYKDDLVKEYIRWED